MNASLNRIIVYCLFAFGITWAIAFGLYFRLGPDGLSGSRLDLFHSFAALGPAVAAILTALIFHGPGGLKKLLGGFVPRSVEPIAWRMMLAPLAFFALGMVVHRFAKGEWFDFAGFAKDHWDSSTALLYWLLPLLSYSVFEELGWRGFMLPLLQERFSAWTASMILAPIWALWHIPFFFYRFDFSLFISVGFFFGIAVGTVVLSSVYNSSRAYLLPVIAFHFFNNLCSAFDKEVTVAVMSTGFVFLAVFAVKKLGRENLSRVQRIGDLFR